MAGKNIFQTFVNAISDFWTTPKVFFKGTFKTCRNMRCTSCSGRFLMSQFGSNPNIRLHISHAFHIDESAASHCSIIEDSLLFNPGVARVPVTSICTSVNLDTTIAPSCDSWLVRPCCRTTTSAAWKPISVAESFNQVSAAEIDYSEHATLRVMHHVTHTHTHSIDSLCAAAI